MTTYVLGAGASLHAGYPLCSALWSKMAMWVIQSQVHDSEYRRVVDTITALYGPVENVEELFTTLDLRQGSFNALTEDQRTKLKGGLQRCIREFFKVICDQHLPAPLYQAFANVVKQGDCILTFNYDVALENALIAVKKFRVKNGYGANFQAAWDEPDSEVTLLKLHGSINWIALLFGGATGFSAFTNSMGPRPFVDNVDSVLSGYPARVLDNTFHAGGVAGGATSLVLPTYEKKYAVETSVGDEWGPFYDGMWWTEAAGFLERSDRIVVIGYSMPAADRRSRGLLLWNSNKKAEVLLCCAASNEILKRDFEDHGFWRVVEVGTFSDFLP